MDFEKLGYFYLGKHVDPESRKPDDELLLYRSKDLTTHGVIVGMTGSGKTGLGVALIEEAIIDGVPVIALDPKGDLGNLLLTFPDLEPEDFRPWVNASDAAAGGFSVDEYAAHQAALWRDGLADWGQDSDRITTLESAAERCIYTPGSTAGRPLSMLASFRAPAAAISADAELLGDRIDATVSGLLSMLKIDADPVTSREHVLLANILDHYWRAGRDLDFAGLISAVQSPPFEKVGMMGVETFFPSDDRFDFTLRMNHLLAAPGFGIWLEGDPLDAGSLFYTPEGRPRLSVVSIAHLSDTERMFAVTSLLNEVVSWMRAQRGTSTLRAMLYVDEVFGFLPPVANPPSKKLFLTLLKQARAFGLSTVLATQNPVDLDYKALSNAGTWFIGRLQTERDRARLLDGMSSITAGEPIDMDDLSSRISALDKRQFVLHSIHESHPVVFGTRWVMSYLAGPLTRAQIRDLSDPASPVDEPGDDRSPVRDAAVGDSHPQQGNGRRAGSERASGRSRSGSKPILPAEIAELYGGAPRTSGRGVHYRALLFGEARVAYYDKKRKIDDERKLFVTVGAPAPESEPDWNAAEVNEIGEIEVLTEGIAGATFDVPGASLQDASNYGAWARSLEKWIERNHSMELFNSDRLDLISEPGESEAEFHVRLGLRAREMRDQEVEETQKKLESRLRKVENRLQRAQHALERESQQVDQAKVSSTIAIGQTFLSALMGRKMFSRRTVSRAGTAARSASRIAKETADVDRAQEKVDRIEDEIALISDEGEEALKLIRSTYEELAETFEVVEIRPRVSDTDVSQVGVFWMPVEFR